MRTIKKFDLHRSPENLEFELSLPISYEILKIEIKTDWKYNIGLTVKPSFLRLWILLDENQEIKKKIKIMIIKENEEIDNFLYDYIGNVDELYLFIKR